MIVFKIDRFFLFAAGRYDFSSCTHMWWCHYAMWSALQHVVKMQSEWVEWGEAGRRSSDTHTHTYTHTHTHTHTHSEKDKVLWLIGWYLSFPPDVAPRSLNALFVSAAAQVFFHKRSYSQPATWLRSPLPPRQAEGRRRRRRRRREAVWVLVSTLVQTGFRFSAAKAKSLRSLYSPSSVLNLNDFTAKICLTLSCQTTERK